MEMEGEEEGSDTFKALKTGCFTISVSSSFLSPFGVFSGEKRGIGRAFYIWGVWGKEKEKKRVQIPLKPLKQRVLPYLYPLPFFILPIVFLVKKGGIGRAFYIWGVWGKERERKRRGLLSKRGIIGWIASTSARNYNDC